MRTKNVDCERREIMAGDWIKMRVDLHDDPAVIALSHALKLDEFAVVGRLHKLWAWGDRHMLDGYASKVSAQWIDRYVGCNGFARRMQAVGWLERIDGGIAFPRFDRHNGESAKLRVVSTERKRHLRARPELVADLSRIGWDKCGDKSATREEKKREEGKTIQLKPASAQACVTPHATQMVAASAVRASSSQPDLPTRTPLPADFGLSDEVKNWAEERGTVNLQAHFDFFVRKAKANGYTYANWDSALKNAVIDDWARLNAGSPPVSAMSAKRIRVATHPPGKLKGLAHIDYSEGVTADGRIA
jgi:hypothetical protein